MLATPPKRPFAVQLSDGKVGGSTETSPAYSASLLPATTRTRQDHIRIPDAGDTDFLERELLVKRLNHVQGLLWLCGRPMPPRPLHYQKVLSREIVIVENVELHLVWSNTKIYIKPLPRWLLDADFWAEHIIPQEKELDVRQTQLAGCALGLLFSYTALVAYESDWRIAIETGLLPNDMSWDLWRAISAEILKNHDYNAINPRYLYGELRLGRLDKIYSYRLGHIFRGYSSVAGHTSYDDLLRDNFATLATVLAYVVVVLTAMQVGLATTRLNGNSAFQDASYGFTVFTILAPLIIAAAIVLIVLAMVISNWIATKVYQKRRARDLGIRLANDREP